MAATVLLVGLLYLPTALVVQHYPEPVPWSTCGTDCPPNAFAITHTTPAFVEGSFARCEVLRRCSPRRSSSWPSARTGRAAALDARPVPPWPSSRRRARATTRLAGRLRPRRASRRWWVTCSLALIARSFSLDVVARPCATTALQRLTLGLMPQTTPRPAHGAADALGTSSPDRLPARTRPDGWVSETATCVEPPREAGPDHRGQRNGGGSRHRHRRFARTGPALLQAAASYASWSSRTLARAPADFRSRAVGIARTDVAVTDQARRHRRDVHDGAQQRLVALRIKLALEANASCTRRAAAAELERSAPRWTRRSTRCAPHDMASTLVPATATGRGADSGPRSTPLSRTVQDEGAGRHSRDRARSTSQRRRPTSAEATGSRDAQGGRESRARGARRRPGSPRHDPEGPGWTSRSTAWPRSQASRGVAVLGEAPALRQVLR
jgi:hypothetical protein